MKKKQIIIAAALILSMLSGCSSGEVTQAISSAEETPVVSDNYDTFEESSEAETSKNTETSKDKETSSGGTSSGQSGESGSGSEENEWKETPVTGTKYITEDCYSRIKAIIGSDSVETHTYGSSVKVVAKTDTGYFKLEDGTFIHQDYLSDSKPTQTEPPKTTVKPQTQKPASGSTDNTDGYTWAIQPQYDYDDVEILCDYVSHPGLIDYNLDGYYRFYYPYGECDLVDYRELVYDDYDKYRYYPGKSIKGLYVAEKNGENSLIQHDGNVLISRKCDLLCNIGFLAAFNLDPDEGFVYTNNLELLDDYSPPFPAWDITNAYGLNTGKIYECDFDGATNDFSSFGVGVVVSGNIDTDSLYGDRHHSDVDKSVPGGGKYGLAYNKELVVPCEYDGCLGDFVVHSAGITIPLSGDNRIVFFKNKKIYVFDKTGKCYSKGIYDKVDNRNQELYYLNGYLPVCKNNKWGLIDVNGKEVLSCQFEDITSVYDGKAWAKQNGKWGVIALS